MALQTQSADVLEIALASALYYGRDMVGIPQRLSGTGAQSPMQQRSQPRSTSQPFQLPSCMQAVNSATGADPAIAFQYFFGNLARTAASPPFFHAPVRTEGHAAFGDFQIAPTAQIPAVSTLR